MSSTSPWQSPPSTIGSLILYVKVPLLALHLPNLFLLKLLFSRRIMIVIYVVQVIYLGRDVGCSAAIATCKTVYFNHVGHAACLTE